MSHRRRCCCRCPGGSLFAAGSFIKIGGADVRSIASSNGACWADFQNGSFSPFECSLIFDGKLILGGSMNNMGGVTGTRGIAAWDGSVFTPFSNGISNIVKTLCEFNGDLYVGGAFSNIDGDRDNDWLLRWTGSAWEPLRDEDNGIWPTKSIIGLHEWNSKLVAIGSTGATWNIDGYAREIAAWNGTTWEAFDPTSGENTLGGALYTYSGDLLATMANTSDSGTVHRWDGSSWTAMGGVFDAPPQQFITYSGGLYVCGGFKYCGATQVNGIARWNGSSWVSVGGGVTGGSYVPVNAMTIWGGDLIVGGGFKTTSGTGGAGNFVAAWDGSTWTNMAPGDASTGQVNTLISTEAYPDL